MGRMMDNLDRQDRRFKRTLFIGVGATALLVAGLMYCSVQEKVAQQQPGAVTSQTIQR